MRHASKINDDEFPYIFLATEHAGRFQMGRTTPQRGNKIISTSTPSTTTVSFSLLLIEQMRDHALIRPIDLRGWPSRGSNRPLTTGCCGSEQYRKVLSTKRPFRFANSCIPPPSLSLSLSRTIYWIYSSSNRTGESDEQRKAGLTVVDFRPSGFIIGGGSVKDLGRLTLPAMRNTVPDA